MIFPLNPVFQVVIEILNFHSINFAVNFHCNSAIEALSLQKHFFHQQIRLSLNSNLVNFNSKMPISYGRTALILNTSCKGWNSVIDNINLPSKFKGSFFWLIVTDNINSSERILSKYPIEIDSRVLFIQKTIENYYRIYEVYNTGFYNYGSVIVNAIGYWNKSFYLEGFKRKNLTGLVLRTTVVAPVMFVNQTYEEYVERSKPTKYDMSHSLKYFTLLQYLRDLYHYSYKLIRTNSWGYVRNGSYDGQLGALIRNVSDIGGSPLYFRLERFLIVDATIDVWKYEPLFVFRHPKHPGGYFSIFTRPLSNCVWYCILLTLAAASAVLWLMLKVDVPRNGTDDPDSSISLAALTIWSAICQQGNDIVHHATGVKMVTFVTCVFAVTIYQYYNAIIVSTLLQETPRNIHTSKDVLESSLEAGAHEVVYIHDFFQRSSDPIVRQIYQKKVKTQNGENFFTLEEGMARVKKGGFAFLVDNRLAYTVMKKTFHEEALCDAGEVKVFPPQTLYGIIKKGSPFIDHVRIGMRRMSETGLMARIKAVWDEPRPACVRTPDSSLITVSLREFATPLVALAAGALLAALALLAELALGARATRAQPAISARARPATRKSPHQDLPTLF